MEVRFFFRSLVLYARMDASMQGGFLLFIIIVVISLVFD